MKHRIVVSFDRGIDDYELAMENYPELSMEAALKRQLEDELETAIGEGIVGGGVVLVSLTLAN